MSREWIETRISPDLLDTIGRSFRFRHDKGVAEWLKNSLDSYLRLHANGKEPLTGGWPVLLDLVDGGKRPGPNLSVVDFGGTTLDKIEDFFLHWGDTSAARHGRTLSNVALTGGHGNGGKFYMREMWKKGARFVTWREGFLSSLVVDKSKKNHTGYWLDKNEECDWRDVLAKYLSEGDGFGFSRYIQYLTEHNPRIVEELDNHQRGLSAVIGLSAAQVWSSNDLVSGRHWNHQKLIDAIRRTPQAIRPIKELQITVTINQHLKLERLHFEDVPNDDEFEERVFKFSGDDLNLPSSVSGSLTINKAAIQLVGGNKHLHILSVFDKQSNPVAAYPIVELPILPSPSLAFIYGELGIDYEGFSEFVTNDREKLIVNEFTTTLLNWCANQIQSIVEELDEERAKSEKNNFLVDADLINKQLNQHAHQFLEKLETEIFVDFIEDPEGGGFGEDEDGKGRGDRPGPPPGPPNPDRPGLGGGKGEGGAKTEPGKQAPRKRPRFPEVLLSGFHDDPSNPDGETKHLEKMHPPLYQDEVDRLANVWWINTNHPFANLALSKKGHTMNPIFKNYHLFMFRDVVQREAMRILQKREAEIELDRMETELDEISNRFLGELPFNLAESLVSFDEKS